MENKKQLVKRILASVLFVVFMLPSAVHIFHQLEGHEHAVSTHKTTNVHTTISKCGVCDHQMTSFNIEFESCPDLFVPKQIIKAVVDKAPLLLHSFTFNNTQLRAPPVFS